MGRGCSVQAIGQMLMRGSLSGVSVISHITGCFEDSDPKVRECAAHAFGHMGEEASKVAYLLHGLSEEDESQPVRDAAKNSVLVRPRSRRNVITCTVSNGIVRRDPTSISFLYVLCLQAHLYRAWPKTAFETELAVNRHLVSVCLVIRYSVGCVQCTYHDTQH